MMRKKIAAIKEADLNQPITLAGWVRSVRDQKNFAFIELNDGSTLSGIQIIAEGERPALTTGASITVQGTLVESPGQKQKWEVKANTITLVGSCSAEEYPLQKKRHSFEFLRTIAHLRPRTNTQGAVLRIRNALSFATHNFFQENGFLYVHTPIITASDTEGAGELFRVTTMDMDHLPKGDDGKTDYTKDFFEKPAYLTVSGQLNGEALACGLSDIYTFGPTFRAENSNTARHLAEFWMIEPEMAFCNLAGTMDIAERYIKHVIGHLLTHCKEDLNFFDHFMEKGLLERLELVHSASFARLTYTEAIALLEKSGKKFEFPVKWGIDLQTEHERYLAEEHCKKPVFITDYPESIKAFYMRSNDDGKTVAALDLLVPKIGELIGGSQREDRLDRLKEKIQSNGLDPKDYWWYLQLREYGSVPHSGFGVGFERLVQFVTGVENIRDAIPFPRTPGHADF
jgi:asparaginyl-tRNA synthetase